jgi:hypothetical protein
MHFEHDHEHERDYEARIKLNGFAPLVIQGIIPRTLWMERS